MTVFQEILSRSLSITVIAACILLLRFFLRKAPKKYAYFLWMILLVRLLLPALPELSFGLVPESLHIPRTEAVQAPENVEGSPGIWTEPERESRAAVSAKEEGQETAQQLPSAADAHGAVEAAAESEIRQETMGGRNVSFMELLYGLWLSGVVLLLAVILISYGALWRTLKDGEQIRGNVWKGVRVESPFVFGIFVPRVWIPVWLSGEEMECVIAHEQVHIRRMDYLVKPLFLLAAVFYWFHPAVWLSFVLMNRDMEMSCDEKVMELYGEERREAYSLALLHISMRNSRLLPALAFGESNTKSRIKNILSYRKPRLGFSIGAVLLLAAAAVLLIPGKGQEPQWDNSSLSAFSFARTAWILEGAGELEEQPFGGGEKSRRLTAYYEEDVQFEEEKNQLLEEIFQVYAERFVYGERGNTPSDYRNRYNVKLYFADEAGTLLSIRLLREEETKRPGIEITCAQNGAEVLTGTVIARNSGVTVRLADGQERDVYFVDNKRNIQLDEEPGTYPVGAQVQMLYLTGKTAPDWLEVIDMTVAEEPKEAAALKEQTDLALFTEASRWETLSAAHSEKEQYTLEQQMEEIPKEETRRGWGDEQNVRSTLTYRNLETGYTYVIMETDSTSVHETDLDGQPKSTSAGMQLFYDGPPTAYGVVFQHVRYVHGAENGVSTLYAFDPEQGAAERLFELPAPASYTGGDRLCVMVVTQQEQQADAKATLYMREETGYVPYEIPDFVPEKPGTGVDGGLQRINDRFLVLGSGDGAAYLIDTAGKAYQKLGDGISNIQIGENSLAYQKGEQLCVWTVPET